MRIEQGHYHKDEQSMIIWKIEFTLDFGIISLAGCACTAYRGGEERKRVCCVRIGGGFREKFIEKIYILNLSIMNS